MVRGAGRGQGHLAARAQLPQPAGRGCAERLRRRKPPAVRVRRQATPVEEPPSSDEKVAYLKQLAAAEVAVEAAKAKKKG